MHWLLDSLFAKEKNTQKKKKGYTKQKVIRKPKCDQKIQPIYLCIIVIRGIKTIQNGFVHQKMYLIFVFNQLVIDD